MPNDVSYVDVVRRLRETWETPGRRDVVKDMLRNRARTTKESAEEYLQVLKTLARRGYPTYPEEIRDEMVLQAFRKGQPQYIQDAMFPLNCSNLSKALAAVLRIEMYKSNSNTRRHARVAQINESWETAGFDQDPTFTAGVKEVTMDSDVTDGMWIENAFAMAECDDEGRYETEEIYGILRIAAVANDKLSAQGICYFCKKPGHRWNKCFRLRDILVKNGMRDDRAGNRSRRPPFKREGSTEKSTVTGNVSSEEKSEN